MDWHSMILSANHIASPTEDGHDATRIIYRRPPGQYVMRTGSAVPAADHERVSS